MNIQAYAEPPRDGVVRQAKAGWRVLAARLDDLGRKHALERKWAATGLKAADKASAVTRMEAYPFVTVTDSDNERSLRRMDLLAEILGCDDDPDRRQAAARMTAAVWEVWATVRTINGEDERTDKTSLSKARRFQEIACAVALHATRIEESLPSARERLLAAAAAEIDGLVEKARRKTFKDGIPVVRSTERDKAWEGIVAAILLSRRGVDGVAARRHGPASTGEMEAQGFAAAILFATRDKSVPKVFAKPPPMIEFLQPFEDKHGVVTYEPVEEAPEPEAVGWTLRAAARRIFTDAEKAADHAMELAEAALSAPDGRALLAALLGLGPVDGPWVPVWAGDRRQGPDALRYARMAAEAVAPRFETNVSGSADACFRAADLLVAMGVIDPDKEESGKRDRTPDAVRAKVDAFFARDPAKGVRPVDPQAVERYGVSLTKLFNVRRDVYHHATRVFESLTKGRDPEEVAASLLSMLPKSPAYPGESAEATVRRLIDQCGSPSKIDPKSGGSSNFLPSDRAWLLWGCAEVCAAMCVPLFRPHRKEGAVHRLACLVIHADAWDRTGSEEARDDWEGSGRYLDGLKKVLGEGPPGAFPRIRTREETETLAEGKAWLEADGFDTSALGDDTLRAACMERRRLVVAIQLAKDNKEGLKPQDSSAVRLANPRSFICDVKAEAASIGKARAALVLDRLKMMDWLTPALEEALSEAADQGNEGSNPEPASP